MIRSILLVFALSFSQLLLAQGVNWMTWQEAVEANQKNPKLIFVDVYTDWCGWCKKMDASTFKNPVIADYMNKHYYAVKFDAERKDTVYFADRGFVNPKPEVKRSVHQLARALLDNQMGYPKFVVFNEKFERMSIIPGYHDAKGFEPIVKFFGDRKNFEMSFPDFQAQFEGEIN